MKKLLLLLMIASVAISADATAQGRGQGKAKHHKKQKDHKRDRDDGYRYNDNRYDNRYDNDRNTSNGKYSKNAPRKVRDAFYRDYPNAGEVSWTKDRGIWTANFRGGGIFGGNNSVSYRANGERVSNYNNTATRRRTQDRNTQANGQQRPTVFGKNNNGIFN